MFCPQCEHLNSNASLYCKECGAALPKPKRLVFELPQNSAAATPVKKPRRRSSVLFLAGLGLLIAGIVIAAVAVWLYFTPHLALRGMRSSAQNRDAKTFSSYIDFPVLKENLKAELNAKMLAEMKKNELKNNPFSGLAMAMAPAMINNMIDAYVSPAAIERAFKGEFDENQSSTQGPKPPGAIQAFNPDFVNEQKGEVTSRYDSFNQFVVSYKPEGGASSHLIFERRGIWNWQLISIKLD